MAITVEKPRLPVENTEEQHLACAILIDTSGAMAGYEDKLYEALAAMKQAIEDDDIARERIEICLICFNDDVREEYPWGPISEMDIPRIKCNGGQSTHAAVEFALRRVEERKADYKKNGVTYMRPWLWLLSNGGSDDDDNGSFQALLEALKKRQLKFFGVAIGEQTNEAELAGVFKHGRILRVGKDNLAEGIERMFEYVVGDDWIPHPGFGEKVHLPLPSVAVEFIEVDA